MNIAYEWFRALEKKGSVYGTERVGALLSALGNPERSLKIIHVAGTNGKGTTCNFIESILCAAGEPVGLFTSPAVFSPLECFRFNQKNIKDDEFFGLLEVFYKLQPKVTAFELQFCLALLYFAQKGARYAIIECGLGGKEDATNAISKKELAIITAVSYDHIHILGNTLREIAEQKFGIVKDCPLITYPQSDEVNAVLYRAEELHLVGKIEKTERGMRYGGEEYEIRDNVAVRRIDAAIAVEAARYFKIDGELIKRGVAEAFVAGRNQTVEKNGNVYFFDGAHNPQALACLVQTLAERKINPAQTAFVVGMFKDKDLQANLEAIAAFNPAAVYTVTAPSERGTDSDRLCALARGVGLCATSVKTVENALESTKNYKNTVVCGSFSILAKFLSILLGGTV